MAEIPSIIIKKVWQIVESNWIAADWLFIENEYMVIHETFVHCNHYVIFILGILNGWQKNISNVREATRRFFLFVGRHRSGYEDDFEKFPSPTTRSVPWRRQCFHYLLLMCVRLFLLAKFIPLWLKQIACGYSFICRRIIL